MDLLKAALSKAAHEALEDSDPIKARYVASDTNPDIFLLQVAPVDMGDAHFSLEDTTSLRNALGKERKRADDFDNGIEIPKVYDGIDAATAKSAAGRLKTFEELDPEKEAGKMAEAKIESIRQGIVEGVAQEKTALETTVKKLQEQVVGLAKSEAEDAYMKNGGTSLRLFRPLLDSMIGMEIKADGTVDTRILGANGAPETKLINEQLVNITWAQKIEAMKGDPQFQGIFQGTGHTGAETKSDETRHVDPAGDKKADAPKQVSQDNIGDNLAAIAEGKTAVEGYTGAGSA